ncbi:hypothetical protein [Cyclobacterium plantarum]|uniref:hypothetical protein n=1 Tax=Cyclobacterium plantarum TaxID=2716263 RepID=UPI003F70DAAC
MRKFLVLAAIVIFGGCEEDWYLQDLPNTISFEPRLSDYKLFQGSLNELKPADNVIQYDLNTPLFTDYARKVRFIKLPQGKKMKFSGRSLLDFPSGTILAKTFYYPKNALPQEKADKILETRLLILENGQWNVGVYKWNDQQSEAFLLTEGSEEEVRQILPDGSNKTFSYKIPSNKACTTCHNSGGSIVPIGPRVSNLNSIQRHTKSKNQLKFWMEIGKLEEFDLESTSNFPEWNNPETDISRRSRAYLDVNCAHCHNPSGIASDWSLDLRYDTPLGQTGIVRMKHHIPARMSSNWEDEVMPKIGTTLKHKEGIALIRKYIESL